MSISAGGSVAVYISRILVSLSRQSPQRESGAEAAKAFSISEEEVVETVMLKETADGEITTWPTSPETALFLASSSSRRPEGPIDGCQPRMLHAVGTEVSPDAQRYGTARFTRLARRSRPRSARAFHGREPRRDASVSEAAKLVLERIGSSDALSRWPSVPRSVTLVGQDVLRGGRLRREVTADDWLHFTLATLTHDIGYFRRDLQG